MLALVPRMFLWFSILKCLGAEVFKLLLVFFLLNCAILKWVPLKVIVLIIKFFGLKFKLLNAFYESLERSSLDDQFAIFFERIMAELLLYRLFFLQLRLFYNFFIWLAFFFLFLFFWRDILFGGVWDQVFIHPWRHYKSQDYFLLG